MKRIFTLVALCIFGINAYAIQYYPSLVSAPYGGTAQSVCQGSLNTATSVTYSVCATTVPTGTLLVTPEWYLNGSLVFTGSTFTATNSGTVTLPAGSFTFSTGGSFTGTNGLYCRLTWATPAPGGCTASTSVSGATTNFTVKTAPGVITGGSTVCTGATLNLANPALGGTWTSSVSSVATVGLNTGVVSGSTAGPVTITYENGCGPNAQQTMVVIAPPVAISGPNFVCVGGAVSLSESVTSGTWFSSNPAVASVAQFTGTLYGMSEGSANITFSTGCGSPVIHAVTSRIAPAGITGVHAVCAGTGATLANTSLYGTWSSSVSSVATIAPTTGVANGTSAGVTNITYSTGCGINATFSFSVQITPVTPPAVVGSHYVCYGNVTPLSNTLGGGTWTSNNITIAIVNSVGAVTGAALGNATITYSNTNACGTAFVTHTVTVINLAAPSAIVGPPTVCGGATVQLSTAVYGGTWGSSVPTVATVDTVGLVSGVSAGTTVITYTVFNACSSAFKTFTLSVVGAVPTPPAAITGAANMCAPSTRNLSDATPGGVWSSSNMAAATISSSGVLTAVGGGTTIIKYSMINSCGTSAKTATVTVSIQPDAGSILGPGTVCFDDTIQLINLTLGGVWTSSDSFTVKPILNTGKMRGLALGAATITYTVYNTCGSDFTTFPVSVVEFGPCAHPAGVAQSPEAGELKVYPNPNAGTFTIAGMLAGGDNSATIEVANMLGQVVYKGAAVTQAGELHHNVAANLANGMYIVTIRSGAIVRSLRMTVAQP